MKTMDYKSTGYDVVKNCARLSGDKSFKNLYSIICAHGNAEAAIWLEGDYPHSMTFNQLAQMTDNYSAFLSEVFGKTGRICISADSCKEWFPLFWGLVRSGHDILAVDATMSDEKVAALMAHAGAEGIVSSRVRKIDGCRQILLSDLGKAPEVKNYTPVWGHNVALCTSGTTSDSRVFVYDEEAICNHALFSEKVYEDNKNLIDNKPLRMLAFLPFHHVLGFSAIFIWSIFLGYSTVYLKDRAPQTIVKTARTCHITHIVAVPLLANNLCRSLLANVKKQGIIKRISFRVMSGLSLALQHIMPAAGQKAAAAMFKGVRDQLLGNHIMSIILGGSHTAPETMRILNAIGYYTTCGFGMTETAINSFETSNILANRLGGSVGTPMTGIEYRITGEEKTGELQVRGSGIHTGRLVNGNMLPQDVDSEGWFSTGDIARKDRRGRYHIEGRIKDVIINESGENVYPDELEDTFAGLTGVDQFAVVGLSRKGGDKYEDISFVAKLAGGVKDEKTIAALEAELFRRNASLPVYKRLSRALVTEEPLPLTSTMKVKRIALKKMISDGTIQFRELNLNKTMPLFRSNMRATAKKDESKDDGIRSKIRTIFAEVLNVPEKTIDDNANFIEDLGGDSLQMMEITVKAEEMFGIFISTEASSRCLTVAGAAEYVRELLNGETAAASGKLTEHKAITSFEDTPEFRSFQHRMDSLASDGGENPYFVSHDSPSLDTSIIGGRTVVDFGNYNYVGMSGRKEVSEAAIAAINKYGTSAGGSRLLAGEKPVHKELERSIAEWKNAESALVCVGGHSTNVTVVGNFCGKNDLIVYDALAHNSIEQGCRLSPAKSKSFPHNDIAALERILKAQRKYFEKVLIVIEGVYSMDGDIADVPAFVEIKKKYGCFLMVDEAHSSCVLGATGGGVDEYFHLDKDDIDIKYGTLSKGLGTCGGYIAGKKSLVEYLRYNLPGFVFSVGISPALAAGACEAIRLLRNEPSIMERLHSNIDFFADEAHKRHLDICLGGKTAILPVLVGKDEDAFLLSSELLKRGVSVPPAVYPAVPKNKARLRFDVISEHKPEQITFALDTLVETARDLGITLPAA